MLVAIGSMISLAYYLRVIAAVWMSPRPKPIPAMAGASPEADGTAAITSGKVEAGRAIDGGPSGGRCALVLGVLAICAIGTVGFGIYPDPLLDFASNAGSAITEILFG